MGILTRDQAGLWLILIYYSPYGDSCQLGIRACGRNHMATFPEPLVRWVADRMRRGKWPWSIPK